MELRWLDGPLWPSNDSEGGGTRQLAGVSRVGDEGTFPPLEKKRNAKIALVSALNVIYFCHFREIDPSKKSPWYRM